MKHLGLAAVALCVTCVSAPSFAAEELSDDRLAAILMQVLAFDRKLDARGGEALTLGVVRPAGKEARRSAQHMLVALQGLEAFSVQGMRIKVIDLELADAPAFANTVENAQVDVLFVTKGLGAQLPFITAVCAEKKILSLAGELEYLRRGLAAGVFADAGKPKIYINVGASRGAGAMFLPELLRLATLVDEQ